MKFSLTPTCLEWELYNEIEEFSKDLSVVNQKFELTPTEKLWDDLTLNPPTDLKNLMMRVEMYARLEEDVGQAERTLRSSSKGEGSFKKWKESMR